MAKTIELTLNAGDRAPDRKIWPPVKPENHVQEILAAI